MKHQRVVVDYGYMLGVSLLFLLIVLSGYVLLKLVHAIFWLPGYLEKQQKRIEKMAQDEATKENEELIEDTEEQDEDLREKFEKPVMSKVTGEKKQK